MTDKNIYESMRDDARAVGKNALGCVVAAIVAVFIAVAIVLNAIIILVAHLLFYAALVVLLSIPLYIGLEVFYYRIFAHSKQIPSRYRRRRAKAENLLRACVDSRVALERRLHQLSEADQLRMADELQTFRAREARLSAETRYIATIEANWIRERLNVIQLRRLGTLRRLSTMSDSELQARLLALDGEADAFESRLRDLKACYDVDADLPNALNGRQPLVAYIRVAVHSPCRLTRREACAPRVSLLFAEWPVLLLALIAAALSSLVVAAVLSTGLPRW